MGLVVQLALLGKGTEPSLIGPLNWLVLSTQAFAGIVFLDYNICLFIMFGCPSLNRVLPEISLSKSWVSFHEGILYQTGSFISVPLLDNTRIIITGPASAAFSLLPVLIRAGT